MSFPLLTAASTIASAAFAGVGITNAWNAVTGRKQAKELDDRRHESNEEQSSYNRQTQLEIADRSAKAQRQIAEENREHQEYLERKRERLALEIEKQRFLVQCQEGALNRQTQYDIAEDNRAHSSYENALNREFHGREGALNRQTQYDIAYLSREAQKELEEYRQSWENLRQQNRMEFEKQITKERQHHELLLQRMSQEFSIAMAMFQNQLARETDEYRRTLDNHPLRIFPINLLKEYEK